MNERAIRVAALGKQYHIGERRVQHGDLREAFIATLSAPWRRAHGWLTSKWAGRPTVDDTFWALRDVSFTVDQGEALGIIGRNGAGKSTLLKVLARITEPTAGSAHLHGRVSSLLEVGTGFHPELTGRENIYLNGAILGMRRVEIEHKFDEIVAFSEIERFIDTPVKRYSSGMYLRLAFAVAAHLEPEVMLIDEVLAVGDAAFQRKCLGKMTGVARQGRTILFVSHNMGAITQLCRRAIWIADGQVKLDGPAAEVVSAYLTEGTTDQSNWINPAPAQPGQEVHLASVRVLDAGGQTTAQVNFNCPFKIEIGYDVITPLRDLSVTYQLFDAQENLVFEAMDTDLPEWKGRLREAGPYRAVCEVPPYLLKPGRYALSLAAFVERVKIIERQARVMTFDVTEVGYQLNPGRLGVISPVLPWTISAPAGADRRT